MNCFAQQATTTDATQPAATLADAQKAYVSGHWKEAARLFETACQNEPDSVRAECMLWNVLALSQVGSAKEFSTAGKRLDSLIQNTNPQRTVYADLMMTKAQFQLYMGRNDKAAEALIHAIETSKPHQAVVLKKICKAIQPKVKNEMLDETCRRLDEPDTAMQAKTIKEADKNEAAGQAPKKTEKQPAAATGETALAPAVQPANEVAPAANPAEKKQETAEKPEKTGTKVPEAQEPSEYWILQLGAFSKKENADLLVKNLKKQGISGTIEERVGETRTLYLVQTGKFESKEKAIDYGAGKLSPLNVEFRAILKK